MLRISLFFLLLLPLPGWSTTVPLFVIQRRKNANEVQYQLRVDAPAAGGAADLPPLASASVVGMLIF